jgi:hypothetical protein
LRREIVKAPSLPDVRTPQKIAALICDELDKCS